MAGNTQDTSNEQQGTEEQGKSGIDISNPEVQEAIRQAVESETKGLKNKRDELLGQVKTLKDSAKQFEGIDADQVRNLLERAKHDEETRLLAEGKIDEVLAKRTERMKTDHDKQLTEANQRADKAAAFADKFRGRVLSDEIRAAGSELGLRKEALRDAVYRGERLFGVDDEGQVIANEEAGLDSKGQALTVKTWLESMRDEAPHWFPTPTGGSAPGSHSHRHSFKRSEMTAEQKREYQQKHGQQAFLKLPK